MGDYVIDFNAKTICQGIEEIPITAREYHLIEYLAMHKGQVISRTELYEHIFGEDDSSLSNLLDVNVSRIRNKLGKDFIKTHRGLGYSIAER